MVGGSVLEVTQKQEWKPKLQRFPHMLSSKAHLSIIKY